ncbi:dienelactone hydrolase family protein [Nitrogeniibacter aestuarii]|uniref:dienelactone hydrolase family protein n=1 Tax=Nitrogeniibacter aestuarii TaxID=2815343 RepID=UPI001E292450|nr:alpha/beta hydrolase [Nitrogeniibacter aestuarii]
MSMKLRNIELSLPAGPVWLGALLAHAPDVRGLIIVTQTSAGRHETSREAYVTHQMQAAGFATLLVDLLTVHEEARDPDIRFNTPLLATRLESALDWVDHQPPLDGLARGLFCSGTGSGAAVRAAARLEEGFDALFCRGGRLDLAGAGPLGNVTVPVHVVVGRNDPGRDMVRRAFDLIRASKHWQDVGGADESFSQPGTLETVTTLAAKWFCEVLPPPRPAKAADSNPTEASPASKPL